RRVPTTSGHRRDHDRDLPTWMVFSPLVCACGVDTAYCRNDAHSHLHWGRCCDVSQHRPSGGRALIAAEYVSRKAGASILRPYGVPPITRGEVGPGLPPAGSSVIPTLW